MRPLPPRQGDAELVVEAATGGHLARLHDGTTGSDFATPATHFAESAAPDPGLLPGRWKLDGRRDPLAGKLASALSRRQSR